MEQIKINDGSKTYMIVNQDGKELGTFTFVPTDSNLAERYKKVLDALEEIKADVPTSEDAAAEFFEKANGLLKEKMDDLFGYSTEPFWRVCGPLTVLDNGDTYIESVLDGVGAIISNAIETNAKAVQDRMDKYTGQYV